MMKYRVVIRPAKEGGFVASVPALEGCFTQGETIEEVRRNIREAIEAYIESLRMDHLPIPEDIYSEEVEVSA